jgi:1,6-anhydro-N-acetylmuramate kinase
MQQAVGKSALDLAIVHGQTLAHAPPDSWQLIDTAVIAAGLGCPVAGDVRAGDLACGGQGAPITPLGDWMLFRSEHPTAVVNLGGFCNITWLPGTDDPDDIRAADICPCNHLLDAAARQRLGMPYDAGGGVAATGTPQPHLVQSLMETLNHFVPGARSLGSGDESTDWINSPHAAAATTQDLLASITVAIGQTIAAAACGGGCEELLIAGGGARHGPLLRHIKDSAEAPTRTSEARGVPVELREAACLALLGSLDHDGVPYTLPQVTGRPAEHFVGMSWCHPSPTGRRLGGT